MLLLELYLLCRVDPPSFQVLASVHAGVGALAQLLQQPVLPREGVEPAVPRLLRVLRFVGLALLERAALPAGDGCLPLEVEFVLEAGALLAENGDGLQRSPEEADAFEAGVLAGAWWNVLH